MASPLRFRRCEMSRKVPPIDRIVANTDRLSGNSDCWNWLGACDADGYGKSSAEGRSVRTHRYVYQALVGPIPDGLTIDHLCRNRRCCNPAHLEPVTRGENNRRGAGFSGVLYAGSARPGWRGNTCGRGHPLAPDNIKVFPGQDGLRRCRTCYRHKKAAEKRKMRASRADQRKTGLLEVYRLPPLDPDDSRHGTLRGFIRHRCRCGPCVAADVATRGRRNGSAAA